MRALCWWNILFFLPLAAGVVLALVSALGIGHDADVDADADADADADTDHDHDHDQEHEGEQGHEGPSLVGGALSLLGVGRVPLMILLTMLLLLFGFIGLTLNQLLSPHLPTVTFVPIAIASACCTSFFVTAGLGRVVSRIVPKEESYATSFAQLAGLEGVVVLVIAESEGYAQVRDRYGTLHEVRCRELDGKPLHSGQDVIVAAVDTQKRVCFVVDDDIAATNEA